MTTHGKTINDRPQEVDRMKAREGLALLCGAAAVVLVVSGCGTPTAPPPPPAPPPPRSLPSPHEPALNAYRQYWAVSDAARAAPAERDWRPELEAVARGDALEDALTDVENYSSIPARTVGAISRSPAVVDATADRVRVVDCVDVSRTDVITEPDGRSLVDHENRVPRFRLHAVVVRLDGRWVVEQASPALDEPC